MTEIIRSVFDQPRDKKLTVEELAEALYEGSPHLEFLMHNLAKQYGDPEGVLPPWYGQSQTAKDFWRSVAILCIKFAMEGQYVKYKNEESEHGTTIEPSPGA